jgi:putative Holliday junction resolvase
MVDDAQSLMGFDYGTRKIGVAAGQALTGSATPLEAVPCRNGRPDWTRIGELLSAWQPEVLVVGLPLNMDGSASESSRRARRFARQLAGRFERPTRMVDERLSTREARDRLGSAAHKGPDPRVDSTAAVVLIESCFAGAQTWLPEETEQP